MLRNYLITAFRNMARHKTYSSINIFGLMIGLICSFFIVLWAQDEMSYGTSLPEIDQVYSVMRHANFGGTIGTTTSMPKPLSDILNEEYPEITHTVMASWEINMVLTHQDKVFRSEGRDFGSDFFTVFKFPLHVGDSTTALLDPESIVISESLARRYLGDNWRLKDDLIGTTLRVDHRTDTKVTAVFEDVPANSSLQFEFVRPVEAFIRENDWVDQWDNNGLRMFARLEKGADAEIVGAKFKDLFDEHVDAWESDVFLHPVSDMYLWSNFENRMLVGGRIDYVRIFLLVAVFILLIASINFMNLATARSMQRAREIGVRKAVGATKSSLARQFIGESMITAMMAFILAIALVSLLLPSFNLLTNKTVTVSLFDPVIWLQFGGLALLTGFLAGSYPAFYLSSFNPIVVLRRGCSGKNAQGGSLRKGLVIFQFMISIIMIVGTFTVYQQLNYIPDKDLGLDRENVVYIDFEGEIQKQFGAFKQALISETSIVNVTITNQNPLSLGNNTIGVKWEGKADNDNTLFSIVSAGYDFVETMKITLKEGRLFSTDYGADSTNYVVNEKAVAGMGMDDRVGQSLPLWGNEGIIVGVIKDFHIKSLYNPIEPVIIRIAPEIRGIVFIRIAAGQTKAALTALEAVYKRFNPEYPFTFCFMDDAYEQTYRSEIIISTLASISAVLAILIACLGLFGLASFTVEQRSKEIGIRKVLGASVTKVVLVLSREFVLLVIGAYAVATPIAYYVMSIWLEDFTFHTEVSVGILAGAGIVSVLISGLTVNYQSLKAATANPVASLRSE